MMCWCVLYVDVGGERNVEGTGWPERITGHRWPTGPVCRLSSLYWRITDHRGS